MTDTNHPPVPPISSAVAVLAMATALAGCGGGGGGSSNFVPSEYISITPGNAGDVASVVVSSLGFSGDLSGGGLVPAAGAATDRILARGWLMPGLRRQALSAAPGVSPSETLPPVTEECLQSGTVRYSGTVASTETLTPGDRLSLEFNNCNDGDGTVLDGGLELVIVAFQGDLFTEVYLLSADTDFNQLSVSAGGDTFSVDGDAELTVDTRESPRIQTTISGSSLSVTAFGDTRILIDFEETVLLDEGLFPARQVLVSVGTLASTALSGRVDYATTMGLEGIAGDVPEVGEILITGNGNGTIEVEVVDVGSVNLNIDLDGNGSVDEVQVTDWVALAG